MKIAQKQEVVVGQLKPGYLFFFFFTFFTRVGGEDKTAFI